MKQRSSDSERVVRLTGMNWHAWHAL